MAMTEMTESFLLFLATSEEPILHEYQGRKATLMKY